MDKKVTYLGKSRKFRNGTIHENASGQFMILDRYLEDGFVMLKIQWMSGDKEGQIEDNKEININASIHKYQVSRGITTQTQAVRTDLVTLNDLYEKIEDLQDNLNDNKAQLITQIEENQRILKWYEEDRTSILKELERMEKTIVSQNKVIDEIYKRLEYNTEDIKEVLTTGAERDDNIKDIANIVDKNTSLIQTITNNLEMFQNQQKMMDKLLEKI